MSDEVFVERREGVQVITINRPYVKNALDGAASREMARAVDELDADDDLRVGVIAGAGGTFCAGMDLKAFAAGGESPGIPGRGFGGITARRPKKPLIAAVEGWALAGGFELMLACDMVVASYGARFGVPEVKRGLVASAGAAVLLPQRVPQCVALEMLLTGEPIGARRAAELGLVNRLVPQGETRGAAIDLAGAIAANGPLAVAVTKRLAYEGRDWTFAESMEKSVTMTRVVSASDDAREGARAFAEKRRPVWTGR
ncbi:crotonase/enoyl-CoA hydratase family protein [Actinomadura sp. B10D3]|uniref:crotonase/enoyl-CoA hydratase family protein n=1 Tax=Actinomadura sp. B10D3 TaxID=3153557 RepID=UPI00325E39B3